jgi:glycine reductase
MKTIRAVHYLNQFFGQLGGEDKANLPPRIVEGPVGFGTTMKDASGGRVEIVRTVICGDNYAAENTEDLAKKVLQWVSEASPDLFIAGPAFGAGRYGIASGTLCKEVRGKLGIPSVTAMHPVNPGVEIAGHEVFVVEAKDSAQDLKRVLPMMLDIGIRLVDGAPIGSPGEEGYLPRGVRVNVRARKRGSARAVEMLLKKLAGEPFRTELPMPTYDRVPPAAPVKDMARAIIAIGTEGGIVPRGNPDRIEAHNASKWCLYDLSGLDGLEKGDYEVAHGGYDPVPATEDPDRVLPLDAARILEKEGRFRKLHDWYPVTVGNVTAVRSAERYGREMGEALAGEGVEGVILTST